VGGGAFFQLYDKLGKLIGRKAHVAFTHFGGKTFATLFGGFAPTPERNPTDAKDANNDRWFLALLQQGNGPTTTALKLFGASDRSHDWPSCLKYTPTTSTFIEYYF
jgi:hypothetical protein